MSQVFFLTFKNPFNKVYVQNSPPPPCLIILQSFHIYAL